MRAAAVPSGCAGSEATDMDGEHGLIGSMSA